MSESYADSPASPWFLFGMGNRSKLFYRMGELRCLITNRCLHRWDIAAQSIRPADYSVTLHTRDHKTITLREDEHAVWLSENGFEKPLTQNPIRLPDFPAHPYRDLLRILHHEILVNIIDSRPLPNILAYDRPWYRDAAMMAMVLQRTANLHLIRDWFLSLTDPYDRNNGLRAANPQAEPDNLGQVLYLASLLADVSHPVTRAALAELLKVRAANHIIGSTDGSPHPVYQTKWLKFGLNSLQLDDPFEIPSLPDSYSTLFWWDFTDQHVPMRDFPPTERLRYPYLGWAEDHFHHRPPDFSLCGRSYPLTWEAHASEAVVQHMSSLGSEFVEKTFCMPHTWHAAEMFLYLIDRTDDSPRPHTGVTS